MKRRRLRYPELVERIVLYGDVDRSDGNLLQSGAFEQVSKKGGGCTLTSRHARHRNSKLPQAAPQWPRRRKVACELPNVAAHHATRTGDANHFRNSLQRLRNEIEYETRSNNIEYSIVEWQCLGAGQMEMYSLPR